MNEHRGLSVALYNPDLVGKREFIAQFIARRHLLDQMAEDLQHERPQHRLLIGQRGMGKSSLLRRLRFVIDDDPVLSARWLPLTFPEEQYNVARLSDFWANCLDAWSDTLTSVGDTAAARALDEQIDNLPNGDEAERAKVALGMLTERARKLKRNFVLLIDNLDILLDRLSTQEHWSLRKTLEASNMVLVGSCVTAPESAFDHSGAFYDWFKVDELRPLSLDEAREVLLQLAEVRGAPHVQEIVRNDPGRVAALHQLTGGNPRTLMLLYDLFARDDVRSVEQDLVALLDHCTPLYKARFESFPQQQQQVIDALALHWAPATAAELAERTRLPVQTISSQLDRLVKQGFVEKVPSSNPRQLFQVGERFFNIWYLMRASRRMRRTLIWLAECLRILYGEAGMRLRARDLSLLPMPRFTDDRERHLALMMAIAQVVDDRGLRNALETKAAEALVDTNELRARITEVLDLRGEDAHLAPTIDRFAALRAMEADVLRAKVRARKGWKPEEFWRLLGGAATLTLEEKRRIVDELPTLAPERLRALTKQLAEEEQAWLKGTRTKRLPEVIRRGYMVAADDVQGAAAAEPHYGTELVDEAMARVLETELSAEVLARIGPFLPHAAEPATWAKWIYRALEVGSPLAEFAKWTEQREGKAEFWHGVLSAVGDGLKQKKLTTAEGILLRDVLGTILDRELVFYPDDPVFLRQRAELAVKQKRFARAEELYQRLVQLPGVKAIDWFDLAKAQKRAGRDDAAKTALRRSLELDPRFWKARVELADQLFVGGSPQNAVALLREGFGEPEVEIFLRTVEALGVPQPLPDVQNQLQIVASRVSDQRLLFRSWAHFAARGSPLAEEIAARIFELEASFRRDLATLDLVLARGQFAESRRALERVLRDFSSDDSLPDLEPVLPFALRPFVRHNKTSIASEVFDTSPLAERLLPLQAALRIIAFPDRYSFERLPAEIREPTRMLIATLMAPTDAA